VGSGTSFSVGTRNDGDLPVWDLSLCIFWGRWISAMIKSDDPRHPCRAGCRDLRYTRQRQCSRVQCNIHIYINVRTYKVEYKIHRGLLIRPEFELSPPWHSLSKRFADEV
jgi:hypothetical protein